MAELAFASWQTIALRSAMIAIGTCSAAEYQRMMTEKIVAMQRSALAAMMPGRDRPGAVIRPWHRAATANAKRLRRKPR
jgi:hypothetical protein